MYIDTHCHLTFPQYDEDRSMVIGNAKKANVRQFVVPGVDALSSRLAVELAADHPGTVFASVGFHPYEAQKHVHATELEHLISGNVVAIGECGLDYHLYKGENAEGKKSNQQRLFYDQLILAAKHNLPAIMHCRDAFEDFWTVIDSLSSLPRGVIHCFSGGAADIRHAQKRGLCVGIDGNVTYSKNIQRIVPEIPLDIMLLETDAPYLTPTPHRGKRNEPKHIPLIAEEVARLQSIPVDDVAAQTTTNARTLFKI